MIIPLLLSALLTMAADGERAVQIVVAPDSPVRLNSAKVLNTGSEPLVLLYGAANTTEAPIRNTKVGNTRSVAVSPFQWACVMKPHAPAPPLLLTMIMNAIVIPRATSSDSSRVVEGGGCSELVISEPVGPERAVWLSY